MHSVENYAKKNSETENTYFKVVEIKLNIWFCLYPEGSWSGLIFAKRFWSCKENSQHLINIAYLVRNDQSKKFLKILIMYQGCLEI